MQDDKAPHPIDIYVGKRVRMQRNYLKMSQTALADKLEVTFQQVQKYEKGTNRISASKLYQIAQSLGVTVSFFYEGLPVDGEKVSGLAEDGIATYVADFYATAESTKLNIAFARIGNSAIRRQIADLTKAVADETSETE